MTTYIVEYAGIGSTLRGNIQTPDASQVVTTQVVEAGTASAAFNARTMMISVKSDVNIHYNIGLAADAADTNDYITTDERFYALVPKGAGWRIDTVAKA